MLRYTFCIHRRLKDEEDWVEYMKRSAQEVETTAARFGMEDWCRQNYRRNWHLAGRLARAEDSRWSRQILFWNPLCEGRRDQARPRKRWADPLERYAGDLWTESAKDPELWMTLEEGFIEQECS